MYQPQSELDPCRPTTKVAEKVAQSGTSRTSTLANQTNKKPGHQHAQDHNSQEP